MPSIDELQAALTGSVLSALRPVARAIYSDGRFVANAEGKASFAVNANIRDKAESSRADVEKALSAHLGRAIALVLVDSSSGSARPATTAPARSGPASTAPAATPAMATVAMADAPHDDDHDEDHDIGDVRDLEDAKDVATSGVDKLTEAFPGAKLIEQEPT